MPRMPQREPQTADAVVEDRGRLPDLPAQLRRLRRRRHRRPARDREPPRPPRRRSASTSSGCRPSTPRRRTTTATTSATTRTSTRRSARSRTSTSCSPRVHDRGMKLVHGPRRQPHLRRAPVVRRVALVEPTSPKRDWYWWRAAAPRHGRGRPGRRADELALVLLRARRGSSTRPAGEYYLHLFSRKQPDLNWENPEVRRGGLRDDALVARPRGRRLPHGRHQHDLQGPGAARRAACRRRPATATAAGTSSTARGSTSSCRRCTARCSPGRAEPLLTVGEMPGVTLERGAAVHRPGARRGRHGLPVRARRRSTRARRSGTPRPLRPARPQGVASAAGRPASPSAAGTACTGTTTTSRASCRASATTASTGSASATMLGTRPAPAPRDAVRLPGRGARHDERAVRLDRGLPRHRVAQPLRRGGRRAGDDPAAVLAGAAAR